MKKILLVNPWIYDFAAYDLWMKPWGLLKISSILRNRGHEVSVVDVMDRHHILLSNEVQDRSDGTGKFYFEEVEKPPLLEGIPRRYKRYGLAMDIFDRALPDEPQEIIMVSSGMTYWYPGVFEAIKLLKRKYDAPVLLGGVYATLCREHAVKYSQADHVVPNERLADISGIFHLECDLSFRNILESKIDITCYRSNPYAVLRVSLGCPFRCAYCAQDLLSPGFMLKSHNGAIEELCCLYGKGIRHFAFYDDALLYDQDYIEEYFTGISKNNIEACFYSPNGLHARFISRKIAKIMNKIKFINPILSLELINDEKTLTWHNKVTKEEVREAVDNLRQAGYKEGEYTVYLMLGIPGTVAEDLEESMDFVHSIGAIISLSEFSPIPGTSIAPEAILLDPISHNNSTYLLETGYKPGIIQDLKKKANKLNVLLKNKNPV